MHRKRNQWFSRYYVIIIILCLLIGLFIWYIFHISLSDLEPKKTVKSSGKRSFSATPNMPLKDMMIYPGPAIVSSLSLSK